MRVSGGDLCTLVQKHRPTRQGRRWVQLIAHGGIGKTARTLSPCRFWRFPSFARGQYPRTAPARKIRNLSHFLEVLQRVEICNWTFSTRWHETVKSVSCLFYVRYFNFIMLCPIFRTLKALHHQVRHCILCCQK